MGRLALAALLALSACAKARPGQPPVVHYGADACARCGMIVSEARFAAGYVDGEGRSVVYDDAGEFLAAVAEQPALRDSAYVADFEDGGWAKAAAAAFVRVPGLATPMGSGVVAFRERARAEAFLRQRGAGALLPAL